tara:strand:+ start:229 stop:948 length:720 start_codon:yes stop_codon:yes gene_type:complete
MQVEITAPTKLNEISLSTYQKFAAIDAGSDQDFIARKMLSIFCNVEDILKVSFKDVANISRSIDNVLKQPTSLQKTFDYKGTRFGFIPNIEDLTFGEFIDLDNFLDWPNMHKAMAVLYRPVTKQAGDLYDIEEYKGSAKYSDLMKGIPLDIVLGAMVFFWTLKNDLLKDSVRSLNQTAKRAQSLPNADNLPQGMDGLQRLIDSQTEILQSKTRLQSLQQANAFILYHTSLKAIESKQQN